MHYGFRLSDGSQLYNGLHICLGFAPLSWGSYAIWLRNSVVGFIFSMARRSSLGFLCILASQRVNGSHLCFGSHLSFGSHYLHGFFADALWVSPVRWLAIIVWVSYLHRLANIRWAPFIIWLATPYWISCLLWLRDTVLDFIFNLARNLLLDSICKMASQAFSGFHKYFGSRLGFGLHYDHGSAKVSWISLY